nr:MAG TPA: hypothetical protein [Caudoviricetes sp.]
MKKIILLIMLILFQIPVLGEDIPPRGVEMTKETNPIFWSYLEDYSIALKEAFEDAKIFHLRGWGAAYEFILTRNGEIKDLKGSVFQNDYYDRKIKDVILSVKPTPFYEGMNAEDMLINVYLGYQSYEELDISIGFDIRYNQKSFSIGIDLDK